MSCHKNIYELLLFGVSFGVLSTNLCVKKINQANTNKQTNKKQQQY